ncbi:hypothetical protein LTR64_003771 [Lithohypha guttulata]|uniref:uncharacterized protein n=1 Tax=Lithohypha guttulata TaxID=1690604 RepID=UPI00315D7462
MDSERTPRPKRTKKTLPTPDSSDRQDGLSERQLPIIPPPAPSSTCSTNTDKTKRSKSPQKRMRDAESLLLKPDLKQVPLKKVRDWEVKNHTMANWDLYKSLQRSITAAPDKSAYDDFFEKDLDRIFNYLVDMPDGADENYWSDDVVFPCLRLAAELTRRAEVRAFNVYGFSADQDSKNIGITDLTLLGASDERPDTRRVDYCFGVSVVDSTDDAHAPILRYADQYLCQSNHPQVNDKVLFSHLELKTDTDKIEANAQLKVWASAGFEKQRRLRQSRLDCDPAEYTMLLAPQPVWVWLSNKVEVKIVVAEWENEHIWFLPAKDYALDIYDKESLRSLVSAMSRVMQWGATEYLNWFRTELLGRPDLNTER